MLLAFSEPQWSTIALWSSITITVITILSLARLRTSEEALQKAKARLEDQIVSQQHDLIRTRETASAWRLEMQRQFDAFRADSSKQLTDAEQRAGASQQHLDETLKRSWKTESDLRQSLERALKLAGDDPEALLLPLLPAVPDTFTPAPEVAPSSEMKAALAASEAKATALQQTLSLERIKARRALAKARKEG
jgi:hypothetical protein